MSEQPDLRTQAEQALKGPINQAITDQHILRQYHKSYQDLSNYLYDRCTEKCLLGFREEKLSRSERECLSSCFDKRLRSTGIWVQAEVKRIACNMGEE